MNIYFVSLGCDKNLVDSEFSSRLLGTEVTGEFPRWKLRTKSAGEPLGTLHVL